MAIRQPESKELRHAIENIIQDTNVAVTTSPSFGSGQTLTLTTTVASNAGAQVLSTLDITFYQDSVSADNQFPNGANLNLGDWIFLGPYSDFASNDGINQVFLTTLVNVSAGTHIIIFVTLLRSIQNTITTVSLQS